MNEDIKALLVKYITGNADANERRLVRQWLDESQDNRDEFTGLKAAWDDAVHHPGQQMVNTNAAFDKLRKRLVPEEEAAASTAISAAALTTSSAATLTTISRRPLFSLRNIAVAASLILLAGAGLLLYKTNQPQPLTRTALDLFVPNGRMKKILLPDSTEVWLNAGTRFSYAASFGQHAREVTLEGEAWFAVRHIDNNPFIVKTHGYTVRDIGTTFTVTAYPGNKHFKTAVMEGEVLVSIDNSHEGNVHLTKNEVLNINEPIIKRTPLPTGDSRYIDTAAVRPQPVLITTAIAMDEFTGWKDHLLIFDEETFDEVARRLERTFDVKIRITNSQLANLRYTGRFNKVENITEALRIISATTPIVYHLQKDTIVISADKK